MNLEAAILNVSLLWILTTPHEFAHAWVATKLGDDTPRLEGRVTLNPLAHVDWLGTLIIPALTSLFGGGFLGWGRPVNTDPNKLRWGMNGLTLVALAGPASNVVLAMIFAVASLLAVSLIPEFSKFASQAVYMSLYLAIFNMIPVPPLDGSKLLLAARVPAFIYNELARFGFLVLLVVMTRTSLGRSMSAWSMQATNAIYSLFSW